MASNSFGKIFRLTTFGESHGPAIGGVIDGCPAGLAIDIKTIDAQLERRKPMGRFWATTRIENDDVEFISGLSHGVTNGAPVAFLIRNHNTQPADYDSFSTLFRPSHADFTWEKKYGIPLESGGGRQSARESAARVVAGSIARQLLATHSISIGSMVQSIGPIATTSDLNFKQEEVDRSELGCPDQSAEQEMIEHLKAIKESGDTAGGVIRCIIKNVPIGLGEPVYDKFQARLAYAMLSINSVKGFEYGDGFAAALMNGSQHNDTFIRHQNTIHPKTNHAGGLLGGITSGEIIHFTVAFKPVSTLMQTQHTVDKQGNETITKPTGRHDVCVVPRARVIVESMAALVVADMLLLSKTSTI